MSGFNSITDEELQRKVDDAAGLFLVMEANPDRWYELTDDVHVDMVDFMPFWSSRSYLSLPNTPRGTYAQVVRVDGVAWAKWFDMEKEREAIHPSRL